tara:strand:+ start:1341 stop:1520 length:180 start_codon:yes stop_codon:yes gene_type:complete
MKKETSKKNYSNDDEPRIKSTKNRRKKTRHNTKENLKNVVQGNLDYDEYMEMEDWSDSR